MPKLAIVGSRNLPCLSVVAAFVQKLRPSTVVVSGAAPGVDSAAAAAARARNLEVIEMPAQWHKFGRSAGPRRNQQLVDSLDTACDGLIAFSFRNSRGTADVVRRARARGLFVRVFEFAF